MKRIDTSKPFAFFLEMLLVLFFFALSSMIILSIYGKAVEIHQEDSARRKALIYAQNQIAKKEDLKAGSYRMNADLDQKGNVFEVKIQIQEDGWGTFTVFQDTTELVCLDFYQGGVSQ